MRADAVPVKAASAVGAGDSFLAAMIWRLASGDAPEVAFRYAVAAGSAALLTPGTDLCHRADVERLLGGRNGWRSGNQPPVRSDWSHNADQIYMSHKRLRWHLRSRGGYTRGLPSLLVRYLPDSGIFPNQRKFRVLPLEQPGH